MTREYIDRIALGIGFCNPEIFESKEYARGWNSAIKIIENAPTADVVEVIRCKDCMYYEDICGYDCFHPKQEHGWNSEGGECLNMNPDDFCSYGKKVE